MVCRSSRTWTALLCTRPARTWPVPRSTCWPRVSRCLIMRWVLLPFVVCLSAAVAATSLVPVVGYVGIPCTGRRKRCLADTCLAINLPIRSLEELEVLFASFVESRERGLDDVPGRLPAPAFTPDVCPPPPFKVFDAALEAAVRWCAAGADDTHDPKDGVGLPRETGS